MMGLGERSQAIKSAVFAVGVIHGLLMARQMYGTRGFSQVYPFSEVQMIQNIMIICSPTFSQLFEESGNLQAFCLVIAEVSAYFITNHLNPRS